MEFELVGKTKQQMEIGDVELDKIIENLNQRKTISRRQISNLDGSGLTEVVYLLQGLYDYQPPYPVAKDFLTN